MYMHELVNDEYFICYKKLATYMSKIIYKKLIHGTYVFFFLFLIIILARVTCKSCHMHVDIFYYIFLIIKKFYNKAPKRASQNQRLPQTDWKRAKEPFYWHNHRVILYNCLKWINPNQLLSLTYLNYPVSCTKIFLLVCKTWKQHTSWAREETP